MRFLSLIAPLAVAGAVSCAWAQPKDQPKEQPKDQPKEQPKVMPIPQPETVNTQPVSRIDPGAKAALDETIQALKDLPYASFHAVVTMEGMTGIPMGADL